MKTIYHYFFCDDAGEGDAFFDIKGNNLKLITSWSANDANFRPEYMGTLFKYFNGIIKPLPTKYEKKAETLLYKFWGV